MRVQPRSVRVRGLGNRWGSCSPAGDVNFHWATVLLSATVAEYVVVHEPAHLVEQAHSPKFWNLVERALPDFIHLQRPTMSVPISTG